MFFACLMPANILLVLVSSLNLRIFRLFNIFRNFCLNEEETKF